MDRDARHPQGRATVRLLGSDKLHVLYLLFDRDHFGVREVPRLGVLMMPDWVGASDDDETLEPWFNDTGDFGDHEDIEGDDE